MAQEGPARRLGLYQPEEVPLPIMHKIAQCPFGCMNSQRAVINEDYVECDECGALGPSVEKLCVEDVYGDVADNMAVMLWNCRDPRAMNLAIKYMEKPKAFIRDFEHEEEDDDGEEVDESEYVIDKDDDPAPAGATEQRAVYRMCVRSAPPFYKGVEYLTALKGVGSVLAQDDSGEWREVPKDMFVENPE